MKFSTSHFLTFPSRLDRCALLTVKTRRQAADSIIKMYFGTAAVVVVFVVFVVFEASLSLVFVTKVDSLTVDIFNQTYDV